MNLMEYFLSVGGRDFPLAEFSAHLQKQGFGSSHAGQVLERAPGYLPHPLEAFAGTGAQPDAQGAPLDVWVSKKRRYRPGNEVLGWLFDARIPHHHKARLVRWHEEKALVDFLREIGPCMHEAQRWLSDGFVALTVVYLVRGGCYAVVGPEVLKAASDMGATLEVMFNRAQGDFDAELKALYRA